MTWDEKLYARLKGLYRTNDRTEEAFRKVTERLSSYEPQEKGEACGLTQEDTMLITYGNTLVSDTAKGLQTLSVFLENCVGDAISHVHLLPMFPYTSDDGFSVVDFRQINPELGTWDDVSRLAERYGLMFDAVINHVSRSSDWFQKFLKREEPYTGYFIECDPAADYHTVTRPRALPLLTKVETADGETYVWTTFSTDQIDLNYHCPDVLAEILDILVGFCRKGAKFIRLDAIGYAWKEMGTSCMGLPQAHELIKLIRDVLGRYAPDTRLITETNVPQQENLSYFGNGHDEANLIYQFPLPPLTMYTMLTGDSRVLTGWLSQQTPPSEETAFFNFLSSHDGIGVRPTEGILTEEQRQILIEATMKNGGRVSYKDNGDGTKSPYELNISYQDALAGPEESDETRIGRFLAAHTLLISLQGMPGIYLNSLVGSRNDYKGALESGIPRRINRPQLCEEQLETWLKGGTNRSVIFKELIRRLQIRKKHKAFSPAQEQKVYMLDSRVIAFTRSEGPERILVLINVTGEEVACRSDLIDGTDLLAEGAAISEGELVLHPYQSAWIKKVPKEETL